MNTNEQIMARMMDTIINQGSTQTGVVTGKPISMGGSLGDATPPAAAATRGGARSCEAPGHRITGRPGGDPGFWQRGQRGGAIFHDAGATIVAIQDVAGTIHNKDGIDPTPSAASSGGNHGAARLPELPRPSTTPTSGA